MPMWRENKELSKYNKYKAKTYLAKMGQVASMLALLARSLGGLHLLVSAHMCWYWFCMHFRAAQVASCHGRDRLLHITFVAVHVYMVCEGGCGCCVSA